MTAARGARICRLLGCLGPACHLAVSRLAVEVAACPERVCVTHHRSRPTAASRIAPEAVNRNPISASGENDSRAIRIPRYVVPQKKHTAPSAA
jgi:hypothetical protein